MEIIQKFLVNNKCYREPKTIKPTRLMVHSTACKGVKASSFLKSWNTYKPGGRSVCIHGFIDETGIYQTLPFDIRAYHCGGTGNNTALGFELCEPANYADRETSMKIINRAVELYAYLCKTLGTSPDRIVSHKEGHAMGIASNHGDPAHWWNCIGYTMDDFRQAVKDTMNGKNEIKEVVLNKSYGDDSRWYLEDAGDGCVFFRNKQTGLYLTAGSTDNGTFLDVRTKDGSDSQKFRIAYKSYCWAQYILIEPMCALGKYASVEGNGAPGEDKTHLKLWDDLHNSQQKFWAKVADDGSYLFLHTYSLMYLSIKS